MSWTDDFLAYVDKFDPAFRHRVRGASDGQIQQIESAMGSPVVPAHREYLQVMGVSDGGFFDSARADTDVAEVLEMVRIVKEENPTADLRTFKPIAGGDVYEGWALNQLGSEWPVVEIDHNLPGRCVAQSLPHLVFSIAFTKRISRSAHEAVFCFYDTNVQFSDLSQEAARLGFLPEWFSDQHSYSAVRPDALLQFDDLDTKRLDGFIGSAAPETLKQLVQALITPFGGSVDFVK
jgi:hypothetical protein